MCKLCSSIVAPVYKTKRVSKTEGDSNPGTNRKYQSPENIFSDDEYEKKFIADVSWIKKDHWIRSEMIWNTIHGIPWKRMGALGGGSYGSVYLGMREDKKLFAVKSINVAYPLTEHSKELIRSQIAEIKMMRYLRSNYIIRCLGCGRSNKENGMKQRESLDVFMEFAIRGSLRHVYKQRFNKPFEEDPYIRQYTYDLLKALQYMCKQRVVHGDIKMANLLLTDDCVKLADWGGAKQLRTTNLKRFLIGTRGFQSPEVLKHQQQSYPSDIFSLGCTVIEMVTGEKPIQVLKKVMGLNSFFHPIEVEEKCVQIPDEVSPECKDFLEHCLCQKSEDRWTAAELLHHPFITNRDKSNKLPYASRVRPELRDNLLQPPCRVHPELPDEPVTKRVYRHLTQSNVPQSWVANLAGCGQTNPPLYSPSPELRNPPPDPLPALVPDLKTKPHETLLRQFPNSSTTAREASGPEYVSPNSSKHIIVETPVDSFQWPATFSSGSHEISTDAVDITASSNQDLLAEVRPHPTVEAKEVQDEMFKSVRLMCEVNNDIYEEAETAAQQSLGDPDQSNQAIELFPHLKARENDGEEI